jgi:hypothetical protein
MGKRMRGKQAVEGISRAPATAEDGGGEADPPRRGTREINGSDGKGEERTVTDASSWRRS